MLINYFNKNLSGKYSLKLHTLDEKHGIEGLTKFHEDTFDLILFDILLPKVDGCAVTKVRGG